MSIHDCVRFWLDWDPPTFLSKAPVQELNEDLVEGPVV